jgi:hypothetical protein
MRGPLTWILAIAGVVLVIVVAAAIGGRDKSGETVTAGEWAQDVCGAVGSWRGAIEAIVDDVRKTPAAGATGTEEPQSETPQGRTALIREGLERSVEATETMIEGIRRAGVPDTEEGEQAVEQVSEWANSALNDLEEAQDSLDEEAETVEKAISQLTGALGAIGSAVGGGVQTIAEIARLDPELAAALRESSTCQELREEAS